MLEGADAGTAPSEFLAREMNGFRDDIRVIPNGLEARSSPYRVREQITPNLIWLRAFHEIYEPITAVDVVARVMRQFPDVTLKMIGPDKGDGSPAAVRSAVSHLGLEGTVETEGAVPKSEVPVRLDRADIFLNTSRIDNAPVTLVEAMACGLPVVTTDAGGIPELVRHEHDALLAPVGDADALADQVRRVLTEPGLAAHLSRNGRESAAQHDWSVVLPMWQELFQEVVRGG
jgi:glycosyltransferase involved in cell wall biosynthesis